MSYQLLLIAPDGAHQIESENSTIAECITVSAEMGSKWCFYPFHFIITNGQPIKHKRIVETPDGYEFLKGKTVHTTKRWFETNENSIIEMLNR